MMRSRIDVEVSIVSNCPTPLERLRKQWQDALFATLKTSTTVEPSAFSQSLQSSFGGNLTVYENEERVESVSSLADDTTILAVHVYRLNSEEAILEELEPNKSDGEDEWTAACEHWTLPHSSLEGSWDSLIFDDAVPQKLLQFAQSALHFADKAVSGHLVHWNRMLLLNGPPGTGKTSLCRALAQKLAVRMNRRFPRTSLLEIHSHSLFSKWFSTSGKLIHRLFELIRDLVQDDPECLVCVLMDEIESLASSRSRSCASGEPTDAVRAVNSLLTGLDKLRNYPNVLLLATTNLTDVVDEAFLDRADLAITIGLPCARARSQILSSSIQELIRVGILHEPEQSSLLESEMARLVRATEGLGGRGLRRLPLQAHALCASAHGSGDGVLLMDEFLVHLLSAVQQEQEKRQQ